MALVSTVNYYTNITPMAGGISSTPSYGTTWRVTIGGTWAANDTYTFNITDDVNTYSLGAGRVTKVVPVAALTLNNRVHFLAGQTWYGSDNGDPTGWEQQTAGAFAIQLASQTQMPENLVALAPYQGRIAIASRRTVQIWIIDANPANITQQQVLANIGTFAPLGMQSIGDLDVLIPSDSGVRSLRVRDSSLNAFVADLGSAIDSLIQAVVAGTSASTLAGACAVVDPIANRYWLFLPGSNTLYVLSYFPSSKIVAWSTYVVTTLVTGAQANVTPVKMVVYNGQVYMRGTRGGNSYIFVYGGNNGTTYDNTVAIMQTPFFDMKRPANNKNAQGVDVDVQGTWQVAATADWIDGTLIVADAGATQATFDQGWVSFTSEGTHFSMELRTTGSTAASVASAILHYSMGESPVDD